MALTLARKNAKLQVLRQTTPRGLKPLILRAHIDQRLNELAHEIQEAIPARERPIAVVVLQGAFIFAADLVRRLPADYPLDIAFLRCQSYGTGTRSSGKVLLLQDIESSVELSGRTVILIDDILDSGLTARFLLDHLRRRGAQRIRSCFLVKRRAASRRRIKPDFVGFTIGSEFIVGYGLDCAGKYRHLPDLFSLQTTRNG